ncbi:MFS transporter [Streptomyces sp. NPDC088090]|uniref:MFS transporter n=1 Tax=Streptomyces sp. NPDC088090 TaxID=3365822 RepID=UPI00384D3C3F
MEQLTGEDPAHIGPYRLIARLGAGGMGLVYLGRSDLGRTVAVKVVQAEHARNTEFRRRFAREVAAARRVGGAWTADVLDADTEADVPWVATQYIPGPDLTTVVSRDFGPLPERSVRVLAHRMALALRAVHEAGLIHRDLKPSNVLVTVDGPRVIDFGIARAMDGLTGDSLHTRTGMLIGSPGFMSPEQARGLELTPASDVFCLGALLVYASTGRLLFGATDTGLNAHLFRIAEEEADLTGVPDSLVDLVRACLHKDPAARPTPHEVAARTATGEAGEWLPGAVLAQLGRRAAHLLDYAPAARPDPRVDSAPPVPAPRAYSPTAPASLPAGAPAPRPGPGGAPTAPAPVAAPEAPLPPRRRGLLFLALAQLLVLFDVASSDLALGWYASADLGASAGARWLTSAAYVSAFVLLLAFGARLGDLMGRKRMLLTGLAGFVAAAATGALAPSVEVLTAARVLQGLAAALITSAAPALLSASFPEARERRKAFGTYLAIAGSGPALGLLAGWFFSLHLSWHLSLFAGIPFALVALIGAATRVQDHPARTAARFDGRGLLLAFCGAVGAGGAVPQLMGAPLILTPASVLLLVAFVWWQTRPADTPDLASGTGPQAPAVRFLVMVVVNAGVVALLAAMGYV